MTDIKAKTNTMKVTVINGPNLNLLGSREPEIYGYDTLDDIAERCIKLGKELNLDVNFVQSNYEGQLVEWVQQAINNVDAIIINAGAYTHTSVAILDALRAFNGYKVELHISNPHARETFRHTSYVSLAADAVVTGLGVDGYELCIEALPSLLKR